ncbi:MAG: S8 family serine peptidase [Candidatus Sericytochromatia bacterium]
MKSPVLPLFLSLSAALATCLAACAPGPALKGPAVVQQAAATRPLHHSGEPVPGQWLVGLRNPAASARLLPPGSRSLGPIGVYLVRSAQAPASLEPARNPEVLFLEPNRYIHLEPVRDPEPVLRRNPAAGPNDPLFAQQYAHQLTQATAGWQISQGSDKVTIAIVDSGIDRYHPELKDKLAAGMYVGTPGSDYSAFYDPFGHGTHVAGIAAAVADNQVGVAGVAPRASLFSARVLDENGEGTNADVVDGIVWAVQSRADILNLSLGSPVSAYAIKQAVEYAVKNGALVVAAMGNEGDESESYPAAWPGVIAVGSTNSKDVRSGFSQFGSWISVSAPGSKILSTLPTYANAFEGKEYGSVSGTSMAAPYVSGLLALIKSVRPELRPEDYKAILFKGVDDLGPPGFDKEYGHGRVNLAKALQAAREYVR